MRPVSISAYIAAFFGLLAAIFLVLSASHGTRPARKAWLRIGLIFAAVSIYLFFFQGRLR